MDDMVLRPVGFVRSDVKEPSLVAQSGDLEWEGEEYQASDAKKTSEIVVESEFYGLLDGIEEFSHILVLYWAHLVKPEGRSLTKVHPIGRKDMPLVGVFSTCSPARPNPVLAIAVRLLERNGNILRVEGLDAVDGSPIVDIKPYLPSYYAVEDAVLSDWMNRLHDEVASRAK